MLDDEHFDYALVGGGLQSGLIALCLAALRPQCRVVLVERDGAVGGNHLWCFHAGDLEQRLRDIISDAVEVTWPGYEVRFPNRQRRLAEPYSAVPSERFAALVTRTFVEREWSLLTGHTATEVRGDSVTLASGQRLLADLVIDARGPQLARASGSVAHQKFVGLELTLSEDTTLTEPVLMDARVAQTDGYRFVYVLPFSRRRVLIEDTYFSDAPTLDQERVRGEVLAYASRLGLAVDGVAREEHGVLPLPWRASPPTTDTTPLLAGYQGGWFHPTTGYSFPLAARLAWFIASREPSAIEGREWSRLVAEQTKQLRFSCFLNRLLFGAFAPEDRWNVMERFYGLPSATVRRFYAHDTTAADRARILCGRPPRGISLSLAISRGAL